MRSAAHLLWPPALPLLWASARRFQSACLPWIGANSARASPPGARRLTLGAAASASSHMAPADPPPQDLAAQQQRMQAQQQRHPMASGGGCPVIGGGGGAAAAAAPPAFAAAIGGCPVVGGSGAGAGSAAPPAFAASACPVVGANPANQMPPSANEPLPGQAKPLSTWRQQSNIPTGAAADALPPHQAASAASSSGSGDQPGVWVYPSEQMFYNAMRRKGWTPAEDDMPAVVAIHNAVNERAWREIQRWEAAKGAAAACGGPRLLKFRGRPQEFSPKARLLNLLGYQLPFDRHDWVVDRCGQEVRYVIDFYNSAPRPDMPVAMHLDVRPALDSLDAVWDRIRMQLGWVGSGRWLRE